METTQVLLETARVSKLSGRTFRKAYKAPRAKTAITAFFCARGNCKECSIGTGRSHVARFVKMFMLAFANLHQELGQQDNYKTWVVFAYQTLNRGRQRPPAKDKFQNLATGMHAKTELNNVQHVYAIMTDVKANTSLRTRDVGKTRRYWQRSENFVADRARLYNHIDAQRKRNWASSCSNESEAR